ncbi:MAG: RNA 2',3'-cyclic phosphodiesterase [Actinomycetota bacterium]
MPRDRSARPEAKALRLFVAVEVPSEARAAVEEAVAPLRAGFPRARWAPQENWHVTLKFLGQTWPRLRTWVEERVAEAAGACAPFETRLTTLGAFPDRGKARVLWAGLDDDAGRMAAIVTALDAALAREFAPETRAFAPHLTVARSDPPLALPEGVRGTPLEPVAFRVDRVTLFRSHLQRPAPRYEPLASFSLGGAG